MSVQEKRVLANIASTTIVSVIYGIVVYRRYMEANLAIEEMYRFWAIAILILIPISVVARIIIYIIFAVGNAVVSEVTRNEEEDFDIVDERDKMIDLRATRISLVIFSAGFVIGLFTQVFDHTPTVFFVSLLLGGFISEVAAESWKIFVYRRGF